MRVEDFVAQLTTKYATTCSSLFLMPPVSIGQVAGRTRKRINIPGSFSQIINLVPVMVSHKMDPLPAAALRLVDGG